MFFHIVTVGWLGRTMTLAGHSIQFRWQLETTKSRFWLVNVRLPKFDTLSEKEMKMIKTHFVMKNNKNMPKKYIKILSNIFLWISHTDPWCNMLQTWERWRKYTGVILSDEHTHRTYFTLLLMLDVNRGTFLSLICKQMHFQDDFNINRYPTFDFKFSTFLDSKTLGNLIIFGAGRITIENLA